METWQATYLREARWIWLFLDYDGTLADFAPTPDHILPDADLIRLIRSLVDLPSLRVTVLSGRRLAHIEKLLPVDGLMLAGTYGIEMRMEDGAYRHRLDYEQVRPLLQRVKPRWEALLPGDEGFFLEDKGWTLALHARHAGNATAEKVLSTAKTAAEKLVNNENFVFQAGHKFLEIAPRLANKRSAVEYLVETYPLEEAKFVYLGDDDKDELAFEAIHTLGGIAGVVGKPRHHSCADFSLASPVEARAWLKALVDHNRS